MAEQQAKEITGLEGESAKVVASYSRSLAVNENPLITYDQLLTFVFYVFIFSSAISIFGIFSNIAIILVFFKMGFSSVSNISLFCLGIADLFTLCVILIISIGNQPVFLNADLMISMRDLARLLSMVSYSFAALGSWITLIINVERVCCVAFPMKVKSIFTPRVVKWLIAGMVIYQIACGLPKAIAGGFVTSISSRTNKTMVSYVVYKPRVLSASYFASFSLPTLVCFVEVFAGTIFLIAKFKQSRRARSSMTQREENSNELSPKDIKLVRSMIFICCIYIVGVAPNVIIYLVSTAYPRFQADDIYLGYFASALMVVGNLFQSIACSLDIFVYFGMGTRFKDTFCQLFTIRSK